MSKLPFNPPSAERVHKRALALAYLACRAMIDGDPNPGATKMAGRMPGLMQQIGLEAVLETVENKFFAAPFGTLSLFETGEASWMVEGVAVLAWAIGRAELPAFGQKCNGAPISIALGMFRPNAEDLIRQSALRDASEIESRALTYLTLNWRIGNYITKPEKMDLASRLKGPDGIHLVVDGVELVGDDMAIDGLPLDRVSPERFSEVAHVVRERFNAFKWLQGYSLVYGATLAIQ